MPTRRTWTFDTEGVKHTVEMEHGGVWSLSGSRVITVDGQVVERAGKFWDTGSEHRFEVGGQPCILAIRHKLFGYEYELSVDGKPIPTQENSGDENRAPVDLWLQVVFGVLFFLGFGLVYFGDKGRFLDDLTPKDRQDQMKKMVRPTIMETTLAMTSPAKRAGFFLWGVAVVMAIVVGIISVVRRFSPKPNTTSNRSDPRVAPSTTSAAEPGPAADGGHDSGSS